MNTIAPPAPYAAVRAYWLARHAEDILEPDLPIVDPHHHLLQRAQWDYMLDDLLADTGTGHNIRATVYIEWQSMWRADGPDAMKPVGETEFVNGAAAICASGRYGPIRACAGIVDYADLLLGARVQDVLEAHLAASSRMRGIRYRVGHDPDPMVNPNETRYPGRLMDARFREGFARLAPLGLTFDALPYHPQLPELISLARAFPETRIVLNHIGGIIGVASYADKRPEVFDAWSRSIRELATCENVFVKLGGMGLRVVGSDWHEKPQPPSSDMLAKSWKPFFDLCIAAFGPNRCMFESNFPVDKVAYSYPVFWNACKKLTAGASPDEKAALFSRTAANFYGLEI